MIPDQVSITRLPEYLRDEPGHLSAINRVLIEEKEGGEYPRHFGLETIQDLRDLGRDRFAAQFPDLDEQAIDWLYEGLKKKPGRPRKAA